MTHNYQSAITVDGVEYVVTFNSSERFLRDCPDDGDPTIDILEVKGPDGVYLSPLPDALRDQVAAAITSDIAQYVPQAPSE